MSVCICKPPPTYPPGGEIAGLHAWRTVLRANAAEFRDRAARHREVGNPDIIVTVNGCSPGPRKAAAFEKLTAEGAVWSEDRAVDQALKV